MVSLLLSVRASFSSSRTSSSFSFLSMHILYPRTLVRRFLSILIVLILLLQVLTAKEVVGHPTPLRAGGVHTPDSKPAGEEKKFWQHEWREKHTTPQLTPFDVSFHREDRLPSRKLEREEERRGRIRLLDKAFFQPEERARTYHSLSLPTQHPPAFLSALGTSGETFPRGATNAQRGEGEVLSRSTHGLHVGKADFNPHGMTLEGEAEILPPTPSALASPVIAYDVETRARESSEPRTSQEVSTRADQRGLAWRYSDQQRKATEVYVSPTPHRAKKTPEEASSLFHPAELSLQNDQRRAEIHDTSQIRKQTFSPKEDSLSAESLPVSFTTSPQTKESGARHEDSRTHKERLSSSSAFYQAAKTSSSSFSASRRVPSSSLKGTGLSFTHSRAPSAPPQTAVSPLLPASLALSSFHLPSSPGRKNSGEQEKDAPRSSVTRAGLWSSDSLQKQLSSSTPSVRPSQHSEDTPSSSRVGRSISTREGNMHGRQAVPSQTERAAIVDERLEREGDTSERSRFPAGGLARRETNTPADTPLGEGGVSQAPRREKEEGKRRKLSAVERDAPIEATDLQKKTNETRHEQENGSAEPSPPERSGTSVTSTTRDTPAVDETGRRHRAGEEKETPNKKRPQVERRVGLENPNILIVCGCERCSRSQLASAVRDAAERTANGIHTSSASGRARRGKKEGEEKHTTSSRGCGDDEDNERESVPEEGTQRTQKSRPQLGKQNVYGEDFEVENACRLLVDDPLTSSRRAPTAGEKARYQEEESSDGEETRDIGEDSLRMSSSLKSEREQKKNESPLTGYAHSLRSLRMPTSGSPGSVTLGAPASPHSPHSRPSFTMESHSTTDPPSSSSSSARAAPSLSSPGKAFPLYNLQAFMPKAAGGALEGMSFSSAPLRDEAEGRGGRPQDSAPSDRPRGEGAEGGGGQEGGEGGEGGEGVRRVGDATTLPRGCSSGDTGCVNSPAPPPSSSSSLSSSHSAGRMKVFTRETVARLSSAREIPTIGGDEGRTLEGTAVSHTQYIIWGGGGGHHSSVSDSTTTMGRPQTLRPQPQRREKTSNTIEGSGGGAHYKRAAESVCTVDGATLHHLHCQIVKLHNCQEILDSRLFAAHMSEEPCVHTVAFDKRATPYVIEEETRELRIPPHVLKPERREETEFLQGMTGHNQTGLGETAGRRRETNKKDQPGSRANGPASLAYSPKPTGFSSNEIYEREKIVTGTRRPFKKNLLLENTTSLKDARSLKKVKTRPPLSSDGSPIDSGSVPQTTAAALRPSAPARPRDTRALPLSQQREGEQAPSSFEATSDNPGVPERPNSGEAVRDEERKDRAFSRSIHLPGSGPVERRRRRGKEEEEEEEEGESKEDEEVTAIEDEEQERKPLPLLFPTNQRNRSFSDLMLKLEREEDEEEIALSPTTRHRGGGLDTTGGERNDRDFFTPFPEPSFSQEEDFQSTHTQERKSNEAPDDPLFSWLPQRELLSPRAGVDAQQAWRRSKGGSGSIEEQPANTVAIIDFGFSLNHEDLWDQWWRNTDKGATSKTSEWPDNCMDGIDNDENGYIDDCYGFSFVSSEGSVSSLYGRHGSAVASHCCAGTNNALGLASIGWNLRPMALRVDGSYSQIAEAVNYAADKGVKVVNLSLGGPPSRTLERIVEAAEKKNIVLVVAAGNHQCDLGDIEKTPCLAENGAPKGFPAAYSDRFFNLISVGAVEMNGRAASFTNFDGSPTHGRVQVMAPGRDLPSCNDQKQSLDGYLSMSGTSFSSPIVAGIVGLVRYERPDLSPREVRSILVRSCKKRPDSASSSSAAAASSSTSPRLSSLSECQGSVSAELALKLAGVERKEEDSKRPEGGEDRQEREAEKGGAEEEESSSSDWFSGYMRRKSRERERERRADSGSAGPSSQPS